MEGATRFTRWLMARLDPYLTGAILEVRAGIGNNVRALLHKDKVIATEPDPEYVRLLENAFRGRRAVEVRQWDVVRERLQNTDHRLQTEDGCQRSEVRGQMSEVRGRNSVSRPAVD